jgi:hypothetical protein
MVKLIFAGKLFHSRAAKGSQYRMSVGLSILMPADEVEIAALTLVKLGIQCLRTSYIKGYSLCHGASESSI